MHGPVPPSAPRPPSSHGVVVTIRVLCTASAVFTCGILSCVPLFRVALVRGRWYDWTACAASLPLGIGAFAVIGSLPESDPWTDVALIFVLLLGALSIAHFLTFDIRRFSRPPAPVGYVPGPTGYPQPGYGYPHPQGATGPVRPQPAPVPRQGPLPTPPPMPPVPADQSSASHPQPGHPQPGQPQSAPPQPGYPQPGHPRIDQVRAELDELSDLLRKRQDDR